MADEHDRNGHRGSKRKELLWDRTADPGADPVMPQPSTRLSGAAVGIDVGGTGVKAALVDLATAELLSARVREKTPQPSVPEDVAATIASVVAKVLDGQDVHETLPVGCGLPGIVKAGRLTSAANIDPGWVGWPATDRIGEAVGRPVLIVNDADAAGLAEMAFGAARGRTGTVLLLTLGTGIGSALFVDGRLVPNTEFGHLEFHGQDAETLISGAARERRGMGWKTWVKQFNLYLARIELYFSPDLVILGGGVSKEWRQVGQAGEDPLRGRDRHLPQHLGHHRRGVRGGRERAGRAAGCAHRRGDGGSRDRRRAGRLSPA